MDPLSIEVRHRVLWTDGPTVRRSVPPVLDFPESDFSQFAGKYGGEGRPGAEIRVLICTKALATT